MSSLLLRLGQLTAGVCVGYFVLWACAPMTVGPPPGAVTAEDPNALGGALSGLGYIVEQQQELYTGSAARRYSLVPGGELDLWYVRRLGDRSQLSARLGGGVPMAFHGGVGYSLRLNDLQAPAYVGASVDGGMAYLRLGLPVEVPVGDAGARFFTRPSLGVSYLGLDHLPLGLSVPAGDAGVWSFEVGTHGLLGNAVPALQSIGYLEAPVGYLSAGYTGRW